MAAGGWLGVGNDPVYAKSRCFDPFPFPTCDEAARARIRRIAEELDAHRKRVQAQNPGLTLTGMYNVLEKLRTDEALNERRGGFMMLAWYRYCGSCMMTWTPPFSRRTDGR